MAWPGWGVPDSCPVSSLFRKMAVQAVDAHLEVFEVRRRVVKDHAFHAVVVVAPDEVEAVDAAFLVGVGKLRRRARIRVVVVLALAAQPLRKTGDLIVCGWRSVCVDVADGLDLANGRVGTHLAEPRLGALAVVPEAAAIVSGVAARVGEVVVRHHRVCGGRELDHIHGLDAAPEVFTGRRSVGVSSVAIKNVAIATNQQLLSYLGAHGRQGERDRRNQQPSLPPQDL